MSLGAVVFDAYGTLLDVNAAMQRHADKLPPHWERISADWRSKQLEYSWTATLTGPEAWRDFWVITEEALDFACATHGITDRDVRRALLDTYRKLPAFPDARSTLDGLHQRGIRTAILSNGETGMLRDAVEAAGLAERLDHVLSVDPIRIFKPDPRVYDLAREAFGLDYPEMGFVSSNSWDAQGAARAGFRTFWCNRKGQPTEYGLDRTATVIGTLSELTSSAALD